MDPQTDFPEHIEDLDCNIDDLETALSPLLRTPLSTTASTLPLLDKAKLYVLAAYSIESLLFSTLQASGANAKEHAVFKELARLKGYFAKIKNAEEASKGPRARVDAEAVARFVKHGLAGNDKYDLERRERIAKEKARASLQARRMHLKFGEGGQVQEQEQGQEQSGALGAEVEEMAPATEEQHDEQHDEQEQEEEEEDHVESENEEFYGHQEPQQVPTTTSSPPPPPSHTTVPPATTTTTPSQIPSTKNSKKRKQSTGEGIDEGEAPTSSPPKTKSRRSRRSGADKAERRAHKQQKRAERARQKGEETILPLQQQAPRTHSETFSALLDGSFAEGKKKGKEKERKGRGKGKGRGK